MLGTKQWKQIYAVPGLGALIAEIKVEYDEFEAYLEDVFHHFGLEVEGTALKRGYFINPGERMTLGVVFILSAIAPGDLHVERFLPRLDAAKTQASFIESTCKKEAHKEAEKRLIFLEG